MNNYTALDNSTGIPELINPGTKDSKINIGFIYAMVSLSMCFLLAIIGAVGKCFIHYEEKNAIAIEMQDFNNIGFIESRVAENKRDSTENTPCLKDSSIELEVIGSM